MLRSLRLSKLLGTVTRRREFDEKRYWIDRHVRLRGDVRSVGNLGKSEDRNRAGQAESRRQLKVVLQHLFPDGGGNSALDLGCGIGLLGPVLVEHGFRYTGVELSAVAVEQARQGCPANAEFQVANLVTYQDLRRFDLVVASYVLVHLVKDEEWITTLRSIASWLRDDGYFLLIDQLPKRSAPDLNRRHVKSRTVERYREILPSCGLKFVDSWLEADRDALGGRELERIFVIERNDARRSAGRRASQAAGTRRRRQPAAGRAT